MNDNREHTAQTQPHREAPEEERDDVDLILRHVSRKFPDALARALLPTHGPIAVGGWIDTQVSGRQRRLDRALALSIAGSRCLLHVEWQLSMTAELPFRVYEYNVLLALAQADEAPPGAQPLPIESVVVLLGGREEPWPAQGQYRTSRPEARFSGVRFRIEPVYQYTIAQLMARDSPLCSSSLPWPSMQTSRACRPSSTRSGPVPRPGSSRSWGRPWRCSRRPTSGSVVSRA